MNHYDSSDCVKGYWIISWTDRRENIVKQSAVVIFYSCILAKFTSIITPWIPGGPAYTVSIITSLNFGIISTSYLDSVSLIL